MVWNKINSTFSNCNNNQRNNYDGGGTDDDSVHIPEKWQAIRGNFKRMYRLYSVLLQRIPLRYTFIDDGKLFDLAFFVAFVMACSMWTIICSEQVIKPFSSEFRPHINTRRILRIGCSIFGAIWNPRDVERNRNEWMMMMS